MTVVSTYSYVTSKISKIFKPKGQLVMSGKTAPLVKDILLEHRLWDLKCVPKRR